MLEASSIPGSGRSFGGGRGNSHQHTCLENLHGQRSLAGYAGGTSIKEPTCQCRRCERHGFDPWVRKIRWRRAWQPIPVYLPGESHGQRNLAGYSPWGCESQTRLSDLGQTEEMAGTALSALRCNIQYAQLFRVNTIIILMLQLRKQRLREENVTNL